ncbi:hypothetical protein [Microbacterium halotolerans]|nr:hypothetical protein [Microbacterium halotolerans]
MTLIDARPLAGFLNQTPVPRSGSASRVASPKKLAASEERGYSTWPKP